jgi:hypothetical protein
MMYKRRLQISTGILATLCLVYVLSPAQAPAQFGFSIVSDPAQESHSLQQLLNDIQKLQKLDHEIQLAVSVYSQMQTNARFFSNKAAWQGLTNQIVRNWSPNSYGATAMWSPMVMYGMGSPSGAWGNVTLTMHTNPYLAAIAGSILAGGAGYNPYARNLANAATVETFDGAGPTAIQTLGNARQQQIQMNLAIGRLQASVADGSDGMNSEVQQLNLLAAGAVQNLQMQETTNNVITSLLEQQTLANKVKRDTLADHMNFITQANQYMVTEGPMWGEAASALSSH